MATLYFSRSDRFHYSCGWSVVISGYNVMTV
ncbi:unnamed protein product [Lathyrus oleraceus]